MKKSALFVLVGLMFMTKAHGTDATNIVAAPPAPDNPLTSVLEDACVAGNLNQVKVLVDQGAPVDGAIGLDRLTPLMRTSAQNLDIIQFLIAHSTQLNATDRLGRTALNRSCGSDDTDVSLDLLKAGADPNLADQDGQTPLIRAAKAGNLYVVTALLSHHADVNVNSTGGSALVAALSSKQLPVIALLLNSGADVNLVPLLPKQGYGLYPALHFAAASGNTQALILLLDHHADINLLDGENTSPIMAAAGGNQAETLQELLDRGAKLDMQSKSSRQTALMMAASHGYLNVAEALVSNKASLELRDHRDRTALIDAARNNQIAVVKLLVTNDADINARDSLGETALAYAGNRGNSIMVDWLARHGATKMDLHVIALPKPQPPLSSTQAWALSVSAVYAQSNGQNPYFLGYEASATTALREDLRDQFQITDKASLMLALDGLKSSTLASDWQEKGARLAALTDDKFSEFLVVNNIVTGTSAANFDAAALRRGYRKWKTKTGLAWQFCVYANLTNRAYTLGYINEKEAWDLLVPNAHRAQATFQSWAEMSDNFLDGREIWKGVRDNSLDACTQLLINPKDPNSPWNQNPWQTPLAPP